MPVTVRNKSTSVVVFSTTGKDAPPATTWAPKGDLDGEDVQQISNEQAQGTRFLRACGMGILEMMDGDGEFIDALRRQAETYARSQQEEDDQVASILDSSTGGEVLRIDEAALAEHIERLAKNQPSDLS